MAGLLDIFGTSGTDTMGLLGMSPEDIARNRDEAQAQALYGLAGRLFKGGSGASSVLEGLQQGQQAYKQAMQGGLQEQLQKAQLQEMLKKKQQEEQQRKDELIANQIYMRGYKPAVAGKESMPIEEDGRFIGDSAAVAAQPARFDIASIAPELMAAGTAGQARLKSALELQKAMGGEAFKLGEGEKQFQRNPLTGEVVEVATGAPKKEPTPADIAKYEYAKKNDGYKGSFTQFLLDEARAKATNINLPTEGERKAGLFQQQMKTASDTIASLGPIDMSSKTNQAAFKSAGGVGNIAVNPKIQQFKQAADQWSESFLRVKTGAAATPQEVELNNRTYFPVFGDDAATVKQKERMRKAAEADMGIVAGRAEVKGSKSTPQISDTALNIELPNDFASQLAAEIARRQKENR